MWTMCLEFTILNAFKHFSLLIYDLVISVCGRSFFPKKLENILNMSGCRISETRLISFRFNMQFEMEQSKISISSNFGL